MKSVAREFRKSATKGEGLLWQRLRARQLGGRKFRRQQPIGPFVVDFFCAEKRLVVEIDGLIHEHQRRADAESQQIIESLALRFVRLPDELVTDDIEFALRRIRTAFLASPPSPLSDKRRGGREDAPLAHFGRGAGGEGYPQGGEQ